MDNNIKQFGMFPIFSVIIQFDPLSLCIHYHCVCIYPMIQNGEALMIFGLSKNETKKLKIYQTAQQRPRKKIMRFYTSTNINKMNNHLSPQHIEHKTRPQHIPFGNPNIAEVY